MAEPVKVPEAELRELLGEGELRDWLQRQRWYASKSRPVAAAVGDHYERKSVAIDADRGLLHARQILRELLRQEAAQTTSTPPQFA